MKTKHTPAPWHVTKDADGQLAVNDHVNFPSEFPIARIYGRLTDKEANAHLIAAAPDLLAALEEIVDCRAIPNKGPIQLWTNARAAIAKAKGFATYGEMLAALPPLVDELK